MAEFTKQSILVTRPDYDTVTHYLYAYAQPVVEAGRNSYFKVIDLEVEKATRKNFRL